MTTIFYVFLLTFFSFAEEENFTKDEFLNLPKLNPNEMYTYDSVVLHKFFLRKNNTYKKIALINSKAVNFRTNGARIQEFQAIDTNLYSMKMVGAKFRKCVFKNVKFYYSDLSFSDFRKCEMENVEFINTATYGLKQ